MTVDVQPGQAPITEDWLREAGFRWSQIELQPSRHWILWLGSCVNCDADGKRSRVMDCEDLGVEVSAGGYRDDWFCWLRSDTAGLYHRFVHVRYLRFTDDLIRLVEGLTGQTWDPQNNWHGVMLHPVHAAQRREERDRLDQKIARQSPWYPSEKDGARVRPLTEHLNAAIESGKVT